MPYSYNDLKNRAEMYSSGKLPLEELRLWSKKAYYEFLLNDFLVIDRIYTYPFIRIFSSANSGGEDISDDEIKRCVNIIGGSEDYFFRYRLTIPQKIKGMNAYESIRHYYRKLHDSLKLDEPFSEERKTAFSGKNIATISDMLEFKIQHMTKDLAENDYSIDMYFNKTNNYSSNKLKDIILSYGELLCDEYFSPPHPCRKRNKAGNGPQNRQRAFRSRRWWHKSQQSAICNICLQYSMQISATQRRGKKYC